MFNLKEFKKQYKIKKKEENHLSFDKEKCFSLALSCKSDAEFKYRYRIAYDKCVENDWIDELILFVSKRKNIWLEIDIIRDIAKKYTNRRDFRKENRSHYEKARVSGYLDDICSHMDRLINANGFWTKEKCEDLAKKFNNKRDFRKKYPVAYDVSIKNGWIDIVCGHMISLGNKYNRCVYVYEFSDKTAYIGLTYDLEFRNKRHLITTHRSKSPVYRYMLKTSLIPKLIKVSNYIDAQDASRLECKVLDDYRNIGWNILNTSKAGSLGSLKKDKSKNNLL